MQGPANGLVGIGLGTLETTPTCHRSRIGRFPNWHGRNCRWVRSTGCLGQAYLKKKNKFVALECSAITCGKRSFLSQRNYISWWIVLQNRKMQSFYTFWPQKTPTSVAIKLCIYARYSNRAYMHSYCSTFIYYFISFFSLLLSVSLVALAFTLSSLSLPPIIRERHTCINRECHTFINREHHIKKFISKSSKTRNQYYTGFVWLPRKTQRKQKIKKINQTQKSTDLWLPIVFPSISTLFHHFLTNQTRNKEN